MKGMIELPLQGTIDVDTAARLALVSTSTVRRWCDEGKVEAWKPAGRWRLDRESLLRLISRPGTVAIAPLRRPVPLPPVVPPPKKRPAPAVTLPLFPD